MKKLNPILIILVTTLLAISSVAYSQSATTEQINDLLEVMKAEEQFVSSMESMAELQKDNPQTAMLPDGFYAELIKTAKAGYKTELLPKVIEIYKTNLTSGEVDQLIALYKTDVGEILLKKMPTVSVEAMNEGMMWGQQLGMQVAQKLMNKE